MRKQMMTAAVTMALGLGIASVAQADIININPQGAGGTLAVGALDWLPGNAIATPAGTPPGDPTVATGLLQAYGHGRLGNFTDANGDPTGSASGFEWTYVFGFQELATPTSPGASSFVSVAGGNNFFRVFYDAVADSSNLQGTGFNDGTLILEGTVLPFDPVTGSGAGNFAATTVATGAFDQFGPLLTQNNYPGITSTSGTGSSDFTAVITFADPNFFPDGGVGALRIITDTFQNLPYQQTNPSSCFFDGTALIGGAGAGNFGGACANTVGPINGLSGPNVMFQTDATSSFISVVPEPGSLALLAVGLLSLIGFSRKKLS